MLVLRLNRFLEPLHIRVKSGLVNDEGLVAIAVHEGLEGLAMMRREALQSKSERFISCHEAEVTSLVSTQLNSIQLSSAQ